MASAFKVLGQSNPAATTLTDAYTVPGSTYAIVSSVTVCNRSATPTTFRLAVAPAGAVAANQHYLAYDAEILANETWVLTLGVTLQGSDVVRVYATLATLSFNVFGEEIT